jgi:hypothetical protein
MLERCSAHLVAFLHDQQSVAGGELGLLSTGEGLRGCDVDGADGRGRSAAALPD